MSAGLVAPDTTLLAVILGLPLAGAAILLLTGSRLKRSAGVLASATVGGSLVLSLVLLPQLVGLPDDLRTHVVKLFDWISVGEFRVPFDLRLDPLSMTMILAVTAVSFLIHVYSIGYMGGEPRRQTYFAHLNLFVFSMLLLVLANNFLVMFIGWELVGLCSYLLIAFWYSREPAAAAGVKAFVVNRIGDFGFSIAIMLIIAELGTVDFGRVLDSAPVLAGGAATLIALLLFVGAVGKSAQVPLHTWLPDAMEGPTPVSALIHAATMVTAGVYMVVRTHAIFEASPIALDVVAVVGLVTALYGATCALAQDDFKRVLAYSTISQLGFMFLAAGLGAYSAAMFLLVSHAAFKAVMFLAAGSVMHGTGDTTDVVRMGGLRRAMPWTAATFVIGALAMSGIPPLSGFFAKDQVLAAAGHGGRTGILVVALVAAFFTALYTWRLAFVAFFGEAREDLHPHESPPVMVVPMAALAAMAVAGGLLGLSAATGTLPVFLEPVLGAAGEPAGGLSELALAAVSVGVALAAIAAAYRVYLSGRVDWLALRGRLEAMRRMLSRGYFVDDAYGAAVVAPGRALAGWLADSFDRKVVDGAVNGIGNGVASLAAAGRRLQTGLVRNYALGVLLGGAIILVLIAVRT